MLRTAAFLVLLAACASALHVPSVDTVRAAPAGTLAARSKHVPVPALRGGGGVGGIEFKDVLKWHSLCCSLFVIAWGIPLLPGNPLKDFGIAGAFSSHNVANSSSRNVVGVIVGTLAGLSMMENVASSGVNASNEMAYAKAFILYHIPLAVFMWLQAKDKSAGPLALPNAVIVTLFGVAGVLSIAK